VPLLLLRLLLGPGSVFVTSGLFFSQAAVVTFGGAYAVLAYVAQKAVLSYGWLLPGEMLDGLGLAETTPGPLILVLEFVGFMAAFRNPGGLPPMLAGTFGALLTAWVTFVPCFLWIFLGAPWIEALRGVRALTDALSAITAAVVGVILNLALWFALHTLFGAVWERHVAGLRLLVPDLATIDWAAVALAALALVLTFRLRVGMLKVLGACAALGVLWTLAAGRA
jgi:chromate transporter